MSAVSNTLTLRDAVDQAVEAYVARNLRSADRNAAAAKVMPGGNTRSVLHFAPFPLAFARAEGAHLWSLDGDRYTDFLGEFTAGLFGHSHPAIMKALRGALDNGISYGGTNDLEHQLAELLCERFPSMEQVRFTNSGTEANLMALALAVNYTGRRGIIAFRGGYHGGVVAFGSGEPSAVTVPHDFILADYNDLDGTRTLIRENAARLGAVLVEPMLGSGGCIPATTQFLTMLREETARCGAVLIFDEVMTSRLSRGGLQATVRVTPDLTTVGKYLAGGMSFGAFGGSAELMSPYDPNNPNALFHAGTFNNNVLSMSAGITGLRDVLTADVLDELNARGDRLRERLNETADSHDLRLHTSGLGSIMTIHPGARSFNVSEPLTEAQAAIKELLFFDLLAESQWIARRGMITLSLPLTDADCAEFVASYDRVLTERAPLIRSLLPD